MSDRKRQNLVSGRQFSVDVFEKSNNGAKQNTGILQSSAFTFYNPKKTTTRLVVQHF